MSSVVPSFNIIESEWGFNEPRRLQIQVDMAGSDLWPDLIEVMGRGAAHLDYWIYYLLGDWGVSNVEMLPGRDANHD